MNILSTPAVQDCLEIVELSRIGRFRVMCHETFSEATQMLLRQHDIDPDTLHVVSFSYDDEHAARARLAVENARNRNPYLRYVYHDAGEDEVIATSIGFFG